MYIFIDTEFTRLPIPVEWGPDPTADIGLISIGLIDETGTRKFYAELADGWAEADCADFTIGTVLPLLQGGDVVRTTEQLQQDLHAWITSFNEPVTLVCDFLVDWLWIKRLLADSWPANLQAADGYQLAQFWTNEAIEAYQSTLETFFDPVLKPQHHALNDAEGLRAAWLAAMGDRNE